MKLKTFILFLFYGLMQMGCVQESNPILFYSNQLKSSIDDKVLKEFSGIDENSSDIREFYRELRPQALSMISSHNDLKSYLDSVRIFEDNSRSYLLLASLHKNLNKESFELESMLNDVKAWEEAIVKRRNRADECDEARNLNSKYNVANFHEGSIVNVDIPIAEQQGDRNGIYFECPLSYETCNNEFLNIKAIILKKTPSVAEKKFGRFTSKIISISRNDVPILYQWYKPNDTFFIDLEIYHRKLY